MIIIDFQNRSITKNGREIVMRSKLLFNMLVYLTNSNGMPRTDREIIEHCWDAQYITNSNVRIRMCELRKIIDDPYHKVSTPDQVIIGVPGVGYKINPRNIKIINQNGTKPKESDHVFLKYAKMGDKQVAVLQKINNHDEWIVIPKEEYDKDR